MLILLRTLSAGSPVTTDRRLLISCIYCHFIISSSLRHETTQDLLTLLSLFLLFFICQWKRESNSLTSLLHFINKRACLQLSRKRSRTQLLPLEQAGTFDLKSTNIASLHLQLTACSFLAVLFPVEK